MILDEGLLTSQFAGLWLKQHAATRPALACIGIVKWLLAQVITQKPAYLYDDLCLGC
jgi:hypothetical protein